MVTIVCPQCGRLAAGSEANRCSQCGTAIGKRDPSLLPPQLRNSARSEISDKSTTIRSLLDGERTPQLIVVGVVFASLLLLLVCVPLVLNGLSNRSIGDADPVDGRVPTYQAFDTALGNQSSLPASTPIVDRASLIERIDPSVVFLEVELKDGVGTGSGFFVDQYGTICTNHHVVGGGGEITIKFTDESVGSGKLVYSDPKFDIAFVRLTGNVKRFPGLIPLATQVPRKGEDVAAFGAPLGLTFTTSFGNVSAIRQVKDMTFIQFTAPVSPGNSGGPIVNMRGEVVGMTTFNFTDEENQGQNLNFALACDDILKVIEHIRLRGLIPQAD